MPITTAAATRALLGYRNALALHQDLSAPCLHARALLDVGDTHLATGHRDDAAAAWHQALSRLTALDPSDAGQVRARLEGRGEWRGIA